MHLSDPCPTAELKPTQNEIWPIERQSRLPRDFGLPMADVFEVLDSRRTIREFAKVSQRDISALLWASQRGISTSRGQPDRIHTPLPTAGGLAAVRTVVINEGDPPWIYLPRTHAAGVLRVAAVEIDTILSEARSFLGVAGGCLLLFAADRRLIERHYVNPETLVLREAGGIQGCLALISAPLGLNFCSLGTLGSDWVTRLLGVDEEFVIPCGAALLGGRQAATTS